MCNLLFSPMSISPEEDESTTTTTTTTTRKSSSSSDHLNSNLFFSSHLLPNSDFYTGQCSAADTPHGVGKYLWADGCMYEGEWKHGVKDGRGKFSWPSGSTYEGQFKSGLMNGYGAKCYSNGDFYDGEWRCGLPHGHGRYLWANGNEYSGEWREGVIGGKGCFVWVGGNRFDGGWEDGRPVGSGRFRWADGSLYIGVWDKMLEEEKEGLYCPSVNVGDFGRRNPKEFFENGLRECGIAVGESVSVVFSRKFGGFDGVGRRGGEEVWDSDEVGEEGRKSSSSSLLSLRNEVLPVRLSPRPERKQGVAIWKGHKNYELMLNLQLGIR